MMKKGAFVLPSEGLGKLNPILIDDVVQGILLAAEHGAANTAYNLTAGQAVDVREYFLRLARALGYPNAVRFVPREVVIATLNIAAKLPGSIPDMPSLSTLRFLQRPGTYDISRARCDLGFLPKADLTHGLESLSDCR